MTDWLKRPENRSLAGVVLGAIAIVLMIGVLGCLPAPVGDPQQAAIDERLSGVWYPEDGSQLWVFWPWDDHGWLLSAYDLDAEVDEGGSSASLHDLALRDAAKAWRTTIADVDFLTLESTAADSEAGLHSEWMTFRMDIRKGEFALTAIDEHFDEFEEWLQQDVSKPDVRAKIEGVLARNADNPEMYASEPETWRQVPQTNYDNIVEYVQAMVAGKSAD